MKNVLFLDTVHPILEDRLTANGYNCIDATQLSIEAIQPLLNDAFGIVIRSRFKMSASFLGKCNNLKFIARSGAGMENIDQPYCIKKNIQLFNAPEGNRLSLIHI